MIERISAWVLVAPGVNITPTPPPGVGDVIMNFLGIVLWVFMIGAILGLFIIGGIGIQAYRHNQAQEFVEKFIWWLIGCGVIAAAVPITKFFFPALG